MPPQVIEAEPKPKAAVPPAPGPFAPLPHDIEIEDQHAIALNEENLARLALIDPERVATRITARERSLELLRVACIKRTHAYDWTLYQDRDQRVVGVLRDSGAVNVRKLMGISIFNYRPTERGFPEPKLSEEQQTDGSKVRVVEMWADGMCGLTGESIEGVYYALRSDDDFIGRERKGARGEEFVSVQDMKASCRTGLDAKVTRILSGLRKVPVEMLRANGVDVDKAHRGRGFGTSAERNAGKVAEADVKQGIEQLRAEILRRVGGDMEAGRKLVKEITTNPEKGFKGFDSLDRLAQSWQIEQAWRNLRKHPIFGDEKSGSERVPGAEG